ncbi:HAD family hydrolase [Jiangella anatolica]|uniref:HAD family hydrolase n=1 Tax=Jiangella anatolica TaxID=2670374 RepID=UPI001314762F|nr:HAD hydrolase-like protein [Jiangella anatolica]
MTKLDGTAATNGARFHDVLVLFDWNGTLVLDAGRARTALNGVLGRRGIAPLTPDDFAERFHLPMATMFTDLGVPNADTAAAESEWNTDVAGHEAAPRPGLAAALEQLYDGGARLGIVSAAAAAAVDADLDRLGVRHRFHTIDTAAADKPHALRSRRQSRANAYYVGDTTYDIRSALTAGFVPIGVADGYTSAPRLVDAGAAAIVADLRQLVQVIAG